MMLYFYGSDSECSPVIGIFSSMIDFLHIFKGSASSKNYGEDYFHWMYLHCMYFILGIHAYWRDRSYCDFW